MPRLKKILVPVDYSDCSRVAMEYALFLAERFDAEIEVLHVAEIPLGEEHTVVKPDTGEEELLSELIMREAVKAETESSRPSSATRRSRSREASSRAGRARSSSRRRRTAERT